MASHICDDGREVLAKEGSQGIFACSCCVRKLRNCGSDRGSELTRALSLMHATSPQSMRQCYLYSHKYSAYLKGDK